MKVRILSFICGVLFSLGLGISGMTQPAKVVSFLDFTGAWDPSLLFVMVGAIAVYFIGYRLISKHPKPFFADSFHISTVQKLDRPLVVGSAIFGIGWGLAGFCPGPALTSLVSLRTEPIIFVGSMLAGMALYEWKKD